MIFFYSICASSLLFSFLAEKSGNKIWMIIAVLSLSLLCGFRGEDVGTDTQTYINSFQTILDGGVYFDIDIGFFYIVRTILWITKSIPLAFTIIAFVTIFLISNTLWHYRDKASFTLMFFFFLCFFYPQCFNIVRQMLAVSFLFSGTLLLEKKRNIAFLLLLLIAATVHVSSIISIGIYAIFFLRNSKHKNYAYMILFFMVLLLVFFYNEIINLYNLRFSYMYDDYQEKLGYEVIAQALLFSFLILTNFNHFKRDNESRSYAIICAVGLFLAIITANAGEASRIAFFFTIYNILFYGVVVNKLHFRSLGYMGFVLLALLNFTIRIPVYGWYGIYPYSMISF